MKFLRYTGFAGLLALATPAFAQDGAEEEPPVLRILLPSGMEAALQEVIEEAEGKIVRFRYIAETFSRSLPLDTVSTDLDALCARHAVPELAEMGKSPVRVVISLADMPSDFGVYNPDVAQVFESYRLEEGRCIWEAF